MEEVKENPNSTWKDFLENPQPMFDAQNESKFRPAAVYARNTLYAMTGISPSDADTPAFMAGFLRWIIFSLSLSRNAAQLEHFRNNFKYDSSPNQFSATIDLFQALINYYAEKNGGFHRVGSFMGDITPMDIINMMILHGQSGDEDFGKAFMEVREFLHCPPFEQNGGFEEWVNDMRTRYTTFKDARIANM